MKNKLDYKKALKILQDKSKYFVYWSPFNGEIRNMDGKTFGSVSTRVADKLLNSGLLIHINNGIGPIDNEKYYKLKDVF